MTQIEELKAWLQSPRYQSGVELYARLSSVSAFKLSLLSKGPDEYNRKLLSGLLTQALQELIKQEHQQHERYPKPLKDELNRGKQLMDVRQALKERIRTLYQQQAPADQIKSEAFRILDITDELTSIYGVKRFVDKNGYLPEPTTHDTDTREALVLRRGTVRTYISRIPGQIAKAADDERRATLETRLAVFKSELLDIENRLAELT